MSTVPSPAPIPTPCPCPVIVADDHPLFRDGLAALLESSGRFRIAARAIHGLDAMAAIREHRPTIALLDHSMPRLSGIEVIRQVRAEDLPTRCALLSSFGLPLLVAEALRAGAVGYLLKEDAAADLVGGAIRLAAGECVISAGIDRAGLRDAMSTLAVTPREHDVLRLLVQGTPATEMAERLGISPRTVETYRNQLVAKFGARNALDLVRRAIESGFVL